jgi:imidazolonepropionase-like amidohydrolase
MKLIFVAGLGALLAACAPMDLLVRDVTVYSGEDAPPFKATVAVKDGVFAAITRDGSSRWKAREVVEGRGMFLTPGLWDMHVHVRIADDEAGDIDVTQFPAHGVTSVRDAGGFQDRIAALRKAIASGETRGPTIYSVGPTLNGDQYAAFHRTLRTRQNVLATIDALAADGVDMVKVHRAFLPDLLPVVIEAAHAHGLKLTGHIPLGVSPLQACELGMDGIEHVGSLLESYISVAPAGQKISGAQAIAYLESNQAQPIYRCLAERGVEVTPTLAFYPFVARSRVGSQTLPREAVEFLSGLKRITRRLYDAGVPLLTGTDTAWVRGQKLPSVLPGSSLLDELEELQRSGIPPRQVLVSATSRAAHALGVDARTGSIAVGKAADFLLLEGDPGIDVANIRKLRGVYIAGARVH